MSSSNNTLTAISGTQVNESPDQQLAARVSAALASEDFVSDAKKASLATKISTGQMNAEDWRIMAASSLQEEAKSTEDASDVDADGDVQL